MARTSSAKEGQYPCQGESIPVGQIWKLAVSQAFLSGGLDQQIAEASFEMLLSHDGRVGEVFRVQSCVRAAPESMHSAC